LNLNLKEKVVRTSTLFTIVFMICWGLVSVVAQVRPFWVDEWRVIYNLKFKSAGALWGPLDFMQQFPRVYLIIVKAFTSVFDYSYFTLRLPSYLIGTMTILLAWRLMKRIYPTGHFNRFLFVMILVSSCTFTNYYVQIKQYTMDLLLSLVALWQFIELLDITAMPVFKKRRYIALCISFLVAPFFSYIYPIAVSPVFMIVFLQSIYLLRNKKLGDFEKKIVLVRQWLPLLICATSIGVFYIVDVAQLMADKGMHRFWGHLMMDGGFNWRSFFVDFFNLFAEEGAGFVYWHLFGILGIASFLFGVYIVAINLIRRKEGQHDLIKLYCVLLFGVVTLLFVAGKFPMGEPRLNSFTIPSMAILMIFLLDKLTEKKMLLKFSICLSVVMYVGVIGNIYTTFFAAITGPEYARKMNIYKSTENAIILAQARNLPILITPEVAFPYEKTLNLPFKNTVPGDWVLKTFPAYKVTINTPVYNIKDLASLDEFVKTMPAHITSVLAGDGNSFQVVRR